MEEKLAIKVSVTTLILNIALSIIKLIAGYIGKSGAMISDAVHSLSDVLTTVAVIVGVKMSNKHEDEDHQYGHEKIESLVAIVMSVVLFLTAVGIGYAGLKTLVFLAAGGTIESPNVVALFAAFCSIIIKEWMFWYTKNAGKKINSQALIADAWHHRSDALSSIGSLIGIGGAMVGFVFLDPIVSIVICIIIIKVALEIAKTSVDQILDKAASKELVEIISTKAKNIKGVMGIDELKTRTHGNKVFVDIEISVDKDITALAAHDIAQNVHDTIEDEVKNIKHVMVHVNPI